MIDDLRQGLETFRLWWQPYALLLGLVGLVVLGILYLVERLRR